MWHKHVGNERLQLQTRTQQEKTKIVGTARDKSGGPICQVTRVLVPGSAELFCSALFLFVGTPRRTRTLAHLFASLFMVSNSTTFFIVSDPRHTSSCCRTEVCTSPETDTHVCESRYSTTAALLLLNKSSRRQGCCLDMNLLENNTTL